jgi:hypothetical protein
MSAIDEQFERIKAVFRTQEIPPVTSENLDRYFEYLKENLTCPCMLTGIESIGHFGWEERFEFGYGGLVCKLAISIFGWSWEHSTRDERQQRGVSEQNLPPDLEVYNVAPDAGNRYCKARRSDRPGPSTRRACPLQ